MDSPSDTLVLELRRGEREAFVRYYELYRAPVYDLVRRLLHSEKDAVPATGEVFVTAYREILLRDAGIDLRERTYKAAIDVCRQRLGDREADRGTAPGVATGADRRERSDLGRRFGQALEMLPFDYQAALLLHDIDGLRAGDLMGVFGVTEDAASTLLFRAGEEFRRALEDLSPDRRAADCRLAEQTAVGAVGRSLSDDKAHRLAEHAGYCAHCARTMQGWGMGAFGLALFLKNAPLPRALETTPVFGATMAIAGASGAAAGPGMLARAWAHTRHSLTSKAAAYALAAACLAVSVGLAVQHTPGDQVLSAALAQGSDLSRSVPLGSMAVRLPISSSGLTSAKSASDATLASVVPSTRTTTASPASAKPRTVVTEPTGPTAPTGEGVGVSLEGGRSTTSHLDAPSAQGAPAVTQEGDSKDSAKARQDRPVSADPRHSVSAKRSHAEPAKTRHGSAERSIRVSGKAHAKAANGDHNGSRHARTQGKKGH